LIAALSRALRGGPAPAAPGENPGQALSPRAGSVKLRTGEDFQTFFTGFLKRLEEV
jgi:hypothetical protein